MVLSSIKKKTKIDIKIEGNTINKIHSTKFLGETIDDVRSWELQVKQVRTKVTKGIGIIIKPKPYINKTTLMNLYHAFVYPHMTYCNIVWGSTYNTHLYRLIILQKKNSKNIVKQTL